VTLQHYARIAGRLDRAKGRGLISEYLVSWRGHGGRLTPKVVVWSETGARTQVRSELVRSLLGLVPSRQILIVDDQGAGTA
jgi:hypothetical protein